MDNLMSLWQPLYIAPSAVASTITEDELPR